MRKSIRTGRIMSILCAAFFLQGSCGGLQVPAADSASETILEDEFSPETVQAPEIISSSELLKEASSSGETDELSGLIEDPGGNKVDPSIEFEITDERYLEEQKAAVYGRLYPPAPIIDGINSFRQGDIRWGTHPYGYADGGGSIPATISSSGCGILSLVNAVYHMTGNFIDPVMLADWAVKHGFRQNGVGTVHGLYSAFASAYGDRYDFRYSGTAGSLGQIQGFLHDGGAAVISIEGHLMAVADYDPAKGGYLLLDSAPSLRRGTYPTGYCYLTGDEMAERFTIYAIFLLQPSKERYGRTVVAINSSGTSETKAAGGLNSFATGTDAMNREIMKNYSPFVYLRFF